MHEDLEQTALMIYLKKAKGGLYHGKILELRGVVQGWLAYVTHTYPHYTQHTIEHSTRIVYCMSRLLFHESQKKRIVDLSALEAYILVAAAHLHDIGMVISDAEKLEIIESEPWKRWTTGDGEAAQRWRDIQALRHAQEPGDPTVRNFLADIQMRYLIAEFVRRNHHLRASEIMMKYESSLGRFAFNEPSLLQTIADVCIAHGLPQSALEENQRYPDRRDILGETVNVRFLAILLRLGDLLDISYDRSCPMLMNAACPLPPESVANWMQYRRIIHQSISPDKIELTVECDNQESHRLLQDWCQWLVDEVNHAYVTMSNSKRHSEWRPPEVRTGERSPTIIIRPAPDATYKPFNWKLELDQDIIFERLIYDLYNDPKTFVRELIQNALDATRCQVYMALRKEGMEPPAYPTQVEASYRDRYPISVTLEEVEVPNSLPGENKTRQILTVSDRGTGMDNDIIRRYFLQVGRSYYTTDEFYSTFGAIPTTSRFGLGFLSVFAVSDRVEVETYKPASQDGPIHLTLTGPRSYLLTDKGKRQYNGTDIVVFLRERMQRGELTQLVSRWCPRVEFPMVVNDLGDVNTIRAETPEQFMREVPDITEEGAKFAVKAFSVERTGIEGELYIFARIDQWGESWDTWSWAQYSYLKKHPQASIPQLPDSLICFHGITVQTHVKFGSYYTYSSSNQLSARLDYRNDRYRTTLSRNNAFLSLSSETIDPAISSRWEEIIKTHLATSEVALSEGWIYTQRLIDTYALSFWDSFPQTIRIYIDGQPQLVSLEDSQAMPLVRMTVSPSQLNDFFGYNYLIHKIDSADINPVDDGNTPTMTFSDFEKLSDHHAQKIFADRTITYVQWSSGQCLVVDWLVSSEEMLDNSKAFRRFNIADLPDSRTIGFSTLARRMDLNIVNSTNEFIKWLLAIYEVCKHEGHSLNMVQFDRTVGLLQAVLQSEETREEEILEFTEYLENWCKLPNLPPNLYPPLTRFEEDMFELRHPFTTANSGD